MHEEMPEGYISKLIFNNGDCLEVNKDDVVIFVGPNNAGKSQALKDIYSLSSRKISPVVISNICIEKRGSLLPLLNKVSIGEEYGNYTAYHSLGNRIVYNPASENLFGQNAYYGDFRCLFVANLDTEARLQICKPPASISGSDNKQHPIHFAAFDSHYRKWLSENFSKAFGITVTPNILNGGNIPLCIGPEVKLTENYSDEQERLEKYGAILRSYCQVQNQGDGIKSFIGILLYLMLDYFQTYLIDEPESFLHPPQARIMGQIIGETLKPTQQAFISTHSEEIIKGLMQVCPQRLKIVRITRDSNKNFFSVLKNEDLRRVWSDPLLKYSNILSSLFHNSVVLCESDSDCKMYSLIDQKIKKNEGKYSETYFIHCGGKQRISKIVAALRALNINVNVIVDIDVLDDKNILNGILDAYGVNWEEIDSKYKILESNLHSDKEKVSREDIKVLLGEICEASKSPLLSKAEIEEIKEAITIHSKWHNLKRCGISAVPAGNATVAFNELNNILKENKIFIVTVGELENFVKDIGGHGSAWVNKVIETYPDMNSSVYDGITEFIENMKL